VSPGDYFYEPVRYLFCREVVGGYPDNTFRPYNTTTRAQLTKMVALAENWDLFVPPSNTFADIAQGSTFYQYIETAVEHGVITGYPCGGAGEPCDGQQRPYFRPGNNVTRAQVAKILVMAEEWSLIDPAGNTFADVPQGSTFYEFVETAAQAGLISGYPCGGAGEPCDGQQRPYFRPGSSATRGQVSKMLHAAVTAP
jgi:hypothetical protein